MATKRWSPYAEVYDPISVASIDGSDTQPHDKAVVRALNNVYNADLSLPSVPENTLFVGRLHPKVREVEIEELFSKYGKVKRSRVVRDIITGHSKMYGFVEFEKWKDADRAHRHAHKTIVRGAEILVDWEKGRTMSGWKPRSLGGGFGGRKESGQLRFGCRDRPWAKPILPENSRSAHGSGRFQKR